LGRSVDIHQVWRFRNGYLSVSANDPVKTRTTERNAFPHLNDGDLARTLLERGGEVGWVFDLVGRQAFREALDKGAFLCEALAGELAIHVGSEPRESVWSGNTKGCGAEE
jgi:hypothetical protein